MLYVLIGVVVVVGVAGVLVLRRRPKSNDLHSVASYHTALGTLEHLAERTGQSPVRVIGSSERPGDGHVRPRYDETPAAVAGGADESREVPPVPVRGNDGVPDPETPLIFDDARPRERARHDPGEPTIPPVRDRAQRHALESMNHRPRRLTTVLTVVVVVVVVGGLAYVGSHRSSTHPAKVAPPTTSTAAQVRTTVTATTAAGAHRHAGKHAGHHRATTPTTTTAPAQLVPVSTSGAAATYAVSTDQYQVAVSATGPCWVLATSTATGATVWTGTLQAGAVQNIEATGGLTLELGAPAVSLTVDHVPVVLPNPFHTPFVATFQPAATAPTGTAPTGTATATTATTAPAAATAPPVG
jgi:hypothetical protein